MDSRSFLNSLIFKYVTASEIDRAFQLEIEAFPPDEISTLEQLIYRQNIAPTLFLGAYIPLDPSDSHSTSSGQLKMIGYIASTLSNKLVFTLDTMSLHIPSGKTVCIQSVIVDEQYRRRGVASYMLEEYIKRLRNFSQNGEFERAALISHEHLIPFYQKAGFILEGESKVIFGKGKWFDLIYKF